MDYFPKICFATFYIRRGVDNDDAYGKTWYYKDGSFMLRVNINYDIDDFMELSYVDICDKQLYFEVSNSTVKPNEHSTKPKHKDMIIGDKNDDSLLKLQFYGNWSNQQHQKLNNKLKEIMRGAQWATKRNRIFHQSVGRGILGGYDNRNNTGMILSRA
eukprot:UN04703